MNLIATLEQKVFAKENISDQEAYELLARVEQANDEALEALYDAAHRITRHFCGLCFDTCSIINCKSGNCPEDCKWCAQSAHYATSAEKYALLPAQESVEQAVQNRRQGIGRFSLVGSGRRPTNPEVSKIAETYRQIRQATDIKCCASLGLCTEEQLKHLYEAGVGTYHCNMETAPSFFSSLCSTHTQADKENTIRAARRVGMRICSGGIIGMGETPRQRVELALYLRRLGVLSIPINILQAISGTPLAKTPRLSDRDVFVAIALFRFICPTAYLRFSGGRMQLSTDTQRKAIYIGINAAITGDMLTTSGQQVAKDLSLIAEMGMTNTNEHDWPV